MKYYKIKSSLDQKIVGSNYPQAYKFIKGYNPEAPKAIFSISKYRTSFPDYEPDLDGIMLSGTAKQTDFVSDGFGLGFIISEKAKKIIEAYNLCPHRFYPLGLYIRKIKFDYYLFRIRSDYSDFVDYKESTFIEYNIASGKSYGAIKVHSKENLLDKREKLKREKDSVMYTIWGDKIVMGNKFNHELDFFSIGIIDGSTYVSERLVNDILSSGLTGWNFIPATNLFVQ
ncbi:hypothetical protein [Dysgonomonas sp.]|jgi:hypothetical protein